MVGYRRHLPHFECAGQPVFVTWRLAGSLPAGRSFPNGGATGRQFAAMDQMLDAARIGPVYLRQSHIAQTVVDAIEDDRGEWTTHAFVVMPNHVHLLFAPNIRLREAMRRIKGASARSANRLLQRTGTQFWQHESFDRLVRDVGEFDRIRRYIMLNPVRAGLVRDSSEFEFLRS